MSAIMNRTCRGRAGHTTRYPAGEGVGSVALQGSSGNSGGRTVRAIRGVEFVIPLIRQESVLKEILAFSKLFMTTNTDSRECITEVTCMPRRIRRMQKGSCYVSKELFFLLF